MGGAIRRVQRIGLAKPFDDRFHASWPVYGNGLRGVSLNPAIQHQLAKTVDVVRMKVREEYGPNVAGPQPHDIDVPGRTTSCIDDVERLAGDHEDAARSTIPVGERASGAAQADVQAFGKGLEYISSENGRYLPVDERVQDWYLEQNQSQ
jgi:hypothetical protein